MKPLNWIREKLVKLLFTDYIEKYVKPSVDKIIDFFDGKKTILSLIAFGLAQYAQVQPNSAMASVLLEIISYLSTTYGVTPTLDGITAASIIGLAVGFFDKIKKWASGEKEIKAVLPEVGK